MLDTIKDNVNIRRFLLKTFLNIIGEVHFNELERRICIYRLQVEEKAVTSLYFGQGKINLVREKSGNFAAD